MSLVVFSVTGLDRDKLDLSIDGNSLKLRGAFVRMINLPNDSNCQHIEASYKNGVLLIKMLRGGNEQMTKIQVKQAGVS
jgi:HSP20 family molecular chaperone IbpA